MQTKNKLTLEQHLQVVSHIAAIESNLLSVSEIINPIYAKSSKQAEKLMLLHKTLSQLKCVLDDDYHALIDSDQFKELGHIYYNLRARYNADGSEIETTLAE